MDAAKAIIDFVIDGLTAELELERELGVKAVEIDRALLVAPPLGNPANSLNTIRQNEVAKPIPAISSEPPKTRDFVLPDKGKPSRIESRDAGFAPQVVFLHDRPLDDKGGEMMAKIIAALGLTKENAPIVVASPIPPAKIVVVLGGKALKKFFPRLAAGPGQWLKTADGREVLVTYSPAYILRFDEITEAVKKMKEDMWRSLKAVRQRLAAR